MQPRLVAVLLFLVCVWRSAIGGISFKEGFPEELQKSIGEDPRSTRVVEDFTLEVVDGAFFLIVSSEGLMRRLPIEKTSAADILNVIETMEEEITVIRESREKKSEPPVEKKEVPVKEMAPRSEEIEERQTKENVGKSLLEWFAFTDPKSRFHLGITLSPEEAGAGGVEFSAGIAFFRFGINAKKGLDVKLSDAPNLAWEAYGVLAQIDVLRILDVTFSTGTEVFLYRVNTRIFERDQIFISVAYKFLFMVVGVRAAVSPSTIIIETGKQRYRTDQVRGVFSFSFAF